MGSMIWTYNSEKGSHHLHNSRIWNHWLRVFRSISQRIAVSLLRVEGFFMSVQSVRDLRTFSSNLSYWGFIPLWKWTRKYCEIKREKKTTKKQNLPNTAGPTIFQQSIYFLNFCIDTMVSGVLWDLYVCKFVYLWICL